jgi:GAF domain-containing protein
MPRGAAVSGLAVRERRAVQSPDILADPRLVIPPELQARVEQASFRSTLAVPLLVQGRPIGALALGDRPGRVFDEEEIRLVQAFADQAALALDTARRFEESQRRLAELERR